MDQKSHCMNCIIFILSLASLLSIVGGCASLPKDFDKTESYSLTEPHVNALGQYVATDAMLHPGMSGFHLLGGNVDALVARALLSKVAERTLDLQYYIFKNDEVAALVVSWVMDAADRGVRVRILIDDIGRQVEDSNLALLSSHENIEVRVFNPFAQRSGVKTDFVFDLGRVERRMHNKSFIVDNSSAIIGGRNIGNEYFTAPSESTFIDLDVLVVGPVVDEISASFDSYWNNTRAYPVSVFTKGEIDEGEYHDLKVDLQNMQSDVNNSPYQRMVEQSDLYNLVEQRRLEFIWAEAHFIADKPEKLDLDLGDESMSMASELKSLIEDTTSELFFVSPYFVPGEAGVALFKHLRKKGVKVRILTNSLATQDVWLVHSGYAPYRKRLLEAGVELHEMKATAFSDVRKEFEKYVEVKRLRLHVKGMVMDNRYVLLGSSNLDPRSIDYNTELGLIIDSPEFAKQVVEGFELLTSPKNSFHLYLEDVEDDNGRVRSKIRWKGEKDGEQVIFTDEPYASTGRKFGAWFMRAFPIEGML